MAATTTPSDWDSSRRREYTAKSGGATEIATRNVRVVQYANAKTPDLSEPNITANWLRFLQSLGERQAVTRTHVGHVQRIWRCLSLFFQMTPPSTTVTADGAVQLAWDSEKHHIEFDVFANGEFEWLYVDRASGAYLGSDGPVDEMPSELRNAFSQMFG